MKFETRLVHAGEPLSGGAVTMPIFASTTYVMEPPAAGGAPQYDEIRYSRLNNTPSHIALHTKLAAIDGAEAALVTSSGMAAITTTLMTIAGPGDHVLVQRGLYGGTLAFIRDQFKRFGIAWTVVDPNDPAAWAEAMRDETVAFYLETIANPTIEVANLIEAATFCRAHAITSIVDNTFASPANFQPIRHGIDISVQSATKYLNGHSDVIAGAITGTAAQIDAIRHELNHWGGTLDPHACFLLQRGLKTLALRVRQQNATALALAEALESHDRVASVLYPGLASHPQHAYACEHLMGHGGMLAFELAPGIDPAQFIGALEMAIYAPSLGGPETLVALPAQSSHVGLSAAQRRDLGISDGLVRVSVGIEATEDVIDDFVGALGSVDSHRALA